MRMTIDVQDPKAFAEWCNFIGAIPKADYETRLKADMVAMLEDLRLAIEELDYPKDCDYACNGCLYWGDVDKLIDEKINALRGENETC